MGNVVLNDAKGAIAEIIRDGADLIVIPLSAGDTDANLADGYGTSPTTLDNFLGGAPNEQTAGGWSRKVIANGSITLTIDDSGNLAKVILPDQTWTGPTAGNNTTDIAICIDGASDAVRRVLTVHDFVVTADGNDVTADFHATNGFWSST